MQNSVFPWAHLVQPTTAQIFDRDTTSFVLVAAADCAAAAAAAAVAAAATAAAAAADVSLGFFAFLPFEPARFPAVADGGGRDIADEEDDDDDDDDDDDEEDEDDDDGNGPTVGLPSNSSHSNDGCSMLDVRTDRSKLRTPVNFRAFLQIDQPAPLW
jgi:hypothetical protein